jgi:hypothetical protein
MVRRRLRAEREFAVALLTGGLMAASFAMPAAAQSEPVIVVPGRPGVPVLMWGVDISGAVIEGEFGLNRPGQPTTVIMPYWQTYQFYAAPPGGYFPSTGHKPRSGRVEVIPPANRPMPSPAEPFYREWQSESAPGPATAPVPYDPPPVIVAPQIGGTSPDLLPRRPAPVVPQPRP